MSGERVTLYFPAPKRKGLVGETTYKGLPVVFCTQRNCWFCNLSAREELQGWPGGRIMVELDLCQRPIYNPAFFKSQLFYSSHLRAVITRERIDTGGEFDFSGLNTIFLTPPSGLIVIDPGGMGFNGTLSLAGLIGDQNIVATMVSHGHQDHWNLAGQVRGPVYASELTSRLVERHLAFEWNPQLARAFHRIRDIKPGQRLNLDSVQVRTFSLPHTIPETMGLDIRGRKKRMVYLGDFRLNGWTYGSRAGTIACLQDLASQRVDILALNIINAHLDGITPSEGLVIESLTDILVQAPGRVIITCFSTNLERISRIAKVAQLLQRPVAFCGAGMEFANELLRIGLKEDYPRERIVIFVTGCQAEEYSALWRIANNENPPMELRRDDTLVRSSRCIPGNEQSLCQLITTLRPQVGRVIVSAGEIEQIGLRGLDIEQALTHVSGHESKEGLRQVLEILRPKQVLPWPQTSPQIEAFQEITESLGIEVLPEVERVIEI